ncbi:HD domain-containing protein [bacterium]|nr:HD domain-containing protein [bacterium]
MHEATANPDSPRIAAARAVLDGYPVERGHCEQVARLAAQLFDALAPLHGLGAQELEWLLCAALLHDIGLSVSPARHHKHSFRLILESHLPALADDEKSLVAHIAHYHRKAPPKSTHAAFDALDDRAQDIVRRLAALLRLADGLDRAHEDAVACLRAHAVSSDAWQVTLEGTGDLDHAAWGAARKAGLFGETYGVELRLVPHLAPHDPGARADAPSAPQTP